ncbi:NfeD family protein [Pseudooceanicola sp.]|uniref:NfeD family protein n=1 Tax=Pseudooceanicola sp. TaxID=1914328 RepID=UPI0035C728AE
MVWSVWWVWIAAALVLGIIEVLAPGFIFLGFSIGALAIGVLLLVGGPAATAISGSLAVLLVVFGLVSALAWVVLRRVVGVRRGQVTIFERDVNDD